LYLIKFVATVIFRHVVIVCLQNIVHMDKIEKDNMNE